MIKTKFVQPSRSIVRKAILKDFDSIFKVEQYEQEKKVAVQPKRIYNKTYICTTLNEQNL
jgi:hypothetical protein